MKVFSKKPKEEELRGVEYNEKLNGIQIFDREKASEGYTLFEGRLIDMNGRVVKKWDSVYLGCINNGYYYAQDKHHDYNPKKFGKYSIGDRLIWEKNLPLHHHLFVHNDKIYALGREVYEYKGRNVEFDVVLVFDLNGKEVYRYSIWEHLKEFQLYHNPLELDRPKFILIPETAKKETSVWGGNYDYYHMNYLSIIPKNKLEASDKRFQHGNWLISFRHGSMLFILDKDSKEIVWSLIYDQVKDNIEGPHSSQMLECGNILIFDNGRYRKWSRVIELNPVTLEIEWEYKDKDFYSQSQGHAQPLQNGNILVTESEKGRIFEITKDKEIVWEYYIPEKSDHPKSLGNRAYIYKAVRYTTTLLSLDNLL